MSSDPSPAARRMTWRHLISVVIVLLLGSAVVWFYTARKYTHTHCIKQSGLWLLEYSNANGGRFPESELGFGDALLKLSNPEESPHWIPFFTNAKDQGDYFRHALADGTNVDESQCSRIYVQGLSEGSNPGIAILFDAWATRGGDHLYNSPGQPKLREIISVDNSMSKIKEVDWPAFVTEQRELLRKEGFSESAIHQIYPE